MWDASRSLVSQGSGEAGDVHLLEGTLGMSLRPCHVSL